MPLSIPDDPGRRGAVAVMLRDGRMLVIRRSRHVVAPGVYCFPGGGIEDGESEEDALIREVREEVGVTIRPRQKIWECVTAWKVQLSWYLAEIAPDTVPTPNPHEVESVHWMTPEEMAAQSDLLESNREFLELALRGAIDLGEVPSKKTGDPGRAAR
ncbi:MAG: NUDIX domain-containing protein [Pirellulales bacterium]|nr:NUDIX domain-containing protein [Pirellulales bacterium]